MTHTIDGETQKVSFSTKAWVAMFSTVIVMAVGMGGYMTSIKYDIREASNAAADAAKMAQQASEVALRQNDEQASQLKELQSITQNQAQSLASISQINIASVDDRKILHDDLRDIQQRLLQLERARIGTP